MSSHRSDILIRQLQSRAGGYPFKWWRSAALTVNRGNAIAWDSAVFDPMGVGSPGASLTVPEGGMWRFDWRFGSTTAVAGPFWLVTRLYVQGVVVAHGQHMEVPSGTPAEWASIGTAVVQVASGQTVSLDMNTSAATGLAIANSAARAWFAGHRVSSV